MTINAADIIKPKNWQLLTFLLPSLATCGKYIVFILIHVVFYFLLQVTYMFEGSRTVHTSEDKFSESWLFDIVDAKLRFFQSVTF